MFFSIIIPIYNSERFLRKCLCSVREQLFDDYEVILVDDGSSDDSKAICEEFVEEDHRFFLIQQENRGPSAARNEGLRRASGKYICFVDSDDYVSPDYLNRLHEFIDASGPDVIFIGYHSVDQHGRIVNTLLPPVGLLGAAQIIELSERDMFGYTWIKCLSKVMIGENLFPDDMSLFEDEVFTCSVLKKKGKIATLPSALYYHVQPYAGTLTSKERPDYCILSDRVFNAWKELAAGSSALEVYLLKKADAFVSRCRYYGFEHEVECKAYFSDLRKTVFFHNHKSIDWFDRCLSEGHWSAIYVIRFIYRLRQRISTLLHHGMHRK